VLRTATGADRADNLEASTVCWGALERACSQETRFLFTSVFVVKQFTNSGSGACECACVRVRVCVCVRARVLCVVFLSGTREDSTNLIGGKKLTFFQDILASI